jgi:hypothetical protein
MAEPMTIKEKKIAAYLSGFVPPELIDEELEKPEDIAIKRFFLSLSREEMRRLCSGKHGMTFQKNVNDALERIFKEKR